MTSSTTRSAKFGIDIGWVAPTDFADFSLKTLLDKHQFVVFRGQFLTLEQQIQLTGRLGIVERAWEDCHPQNPFVQRIETRQRSHSGGKSTSNYWHLDRSFFPVPTRYTLLHARRVQTGANTTQILDTRTLLTRASAALNMDLSHLEATHSFSLNIPRIMNAKGAQHSEIFDKVSRYPDVVHPLVQKTDFGAALYFSELCTTRILGLSARHSDRIVAVLLSLFETDPATYHHDWQPGDVLIWDNFTTVHRSQPGRLGAHRVLHRTTVSSR